MHRGNWLIVGLAAIVLVLGSAGSASAKTVYLRAAQANKKLPNGAIIKVWGYAQCTSFGSGCGAVRVPGPPIVVAPSDPTLTIVLENDLPEATSVVIPGQKANMAPVKIGGRVFSFDKTTPSGNASPVSYTWNLKPGTYIYQSGANPSVQVQMGLYGKVQKDAALKNAYGSAYDRQISVILSEIDPKHHAAISGGNYGPGKAVTSTIGYDPRYYLVNGQPYSPSKGPFTASPGQKILMRFLNAGFEDRFLVIEGTRMSVIAEDGNKLPFPKNTYSLLLPAGKTLDVLVGPLAAGYYSIYERGIASNQMLAYLKVSSPTQRSLNVSKTGSGRVEISSLPGGVYCGPDCTENFNGGTAITLVARPFAGKTFLNWGGACAGTDPTCVLTMNANKAVTANFSP